MTGPSQESMDREALLEKLKAEHRALDMRLAELDAHISLTSEEQIEWHQVKKLKLAKKDQILALQHELSHNSHASLPKDTADAGANHHSSVDHQAR